MAEERPGEAQLRAIAAEHQSDPTLRDKLSTLLSDHLGVAVEHLSSEFVLPPRPDLADYVNERRTFTRHYYKVEPGGQRPDLIRDGQLAIFVKIRPEIFDPPIEQLVNRTSHEGFRAPHFFGTARCSEFALGAWEFVEGELSPFEDLSRADQFRLVRAVAALNAISVDDDVPVLTKWIDAPLERYRRLYRRMGWAEKEEWRDLFGGVTSVFEHHARLSEQLRALGETHFTHNDLNQSNVFMPRSGDVIVFDWEAAGRCVPGADLRFLCRNEAQDELLAYYIDEMRTRGHHLEPDKVRLAYETLEGFRMIHKGWGQRKKELVREGVKLLLQVARASGPTPAVAAPVRPVTSAVREPVEETPPEPLLLRPPVQPAGPDFLCIGQQKAATTWLYDCLQFHPAFWMPPMKELHYLEGDYFPHRKMLTDIERTIGSFADLRKAQNRRLKLRMRELEPRDLEFYRLVNTSRGSPQSLDRYVELFRFKEGQLSGDITPDYAAMSEKAVREVAARLPSLRIVLHVRDPIERAWSELNKRIRENNLSTDALESDPAGILEIVDKHWGFGSRVARRWMPHFPEDRFLIVLFDDIATDSARAFAQIAGFLGAPDAVPSVDTTFDRKAESTKIAMPAALRTSLIDLFRDELLESANLFGGAALSWPARYGLAV